MKHENNILWIDLETTGLDPERCSIIEVAAVMTTADLLPVGIVEEVVCDKPTAALWAEMNDWCRTTHGESGLWDEVKETTVTLDDAECMIVALIDRWLPEGKKPLLGGQSVHFDRGFIRKHMPTLDGRLSHRHLDVSSFMEAGKRWGFQDSHLSRSDEPGAAHRALDDILWSIVRMQEIRKARYPR